MNPSPDPTAAPDAPESPGNLVIAAQNPQSSVLRISSRTAAVLALFSLVFTALMAATYQATEPVIAASAQAEKLKLIDEILPRSEYDNDLLSDFVAAPPMKVLGTDEETRIYRARRGDAPVALVLEANAPDGYSGRISLVMAVGTDGRLLAMRVTGHKETPGLGDYIDPKKDKDKAHPWISQFAGQGFQSVPESQWRVKKDGGRYDQHAGATISARAVTNASRRALAWSAANATRLFSEAQAGRIEP